MYNIPTNSNELYTELYTPVKACKLHSYMALQTHMLYIDTLTYTVCDVQVKCNLLISILTDAHNCTRHAFIRRSTHLLGSNGELSLTHALYMNCKLTHRHHLSCAVTCLTCRFIFNHLILTSRGCMFYSVVYSGVRVSNSKECSMQQRLGRDTDLHNYNVLTSQKTH